MAREDRPCRPNCLKPGACEARRPRRIDYTGQRFGRLTVLAELEYRHGRRVLCRCDCGTEKPILLGNLRHKRRAIKSCGCLRRDGAWYSGHPTHGERRGDRRSPEYLSWLGMKARCYNANHEDYRHWGGRGIRVCDRWRADFRAFLDDMGRKPSPGHSLDRIDVDGHYEPSNCRWATAAEQRANQRPRTVA